MKITPKNIVHTILEIYKENPADSNSFSLGLKSFLEKKNMMYMLPAIIREFSVAEKKELIKNTCTITLADSMHKELFSKDLASKIVSTSVDSVEYKIDSNIVGGFIAEYNFLEYDASVKSSLESLRQHLLEKALSSSNSL